MKGLNLILLSVFSMTCRGTNTTFNWTSVSHTPATSSTSHGIGDYVAAGLGMSTHETSSTSATTTDVENESTDETSSTLATIAGDHRTEMSDSNSQNRTESSKTAILTTAAPIGGASGHIQILTNITNVTSATDCWHSWLDYWSMSSLNHVTYETSFYSPTTETKTEWREANSLIPTSSWQSFVFTNTYSTLATFSSDGYPVSVSVSYDTSTFSKVGFTVVTIWSSLSEFTTTFTETRSWYSDITTTRSTTELPTPGCELPAVVPECSMLWSSYIGSDDWKYYDDFDNTASGYFSGTPDCTQAMITGDWCKSMASFYFARETMYGQDNDVGWVSANSTSYFPASKSLAPGCSLGCQACSITGESVQLYYWPPSTATLVEDGTETATLTPFAQNGSRLRTVSVDGTILTSPTIYISYDILHAANSCGAVGKTYRNTILPLLNTNHLFSLEPIVAYHGYAQGFETSSFNLADLVEPIPDTIYDKQRRCKESSISWLVGGQRNDTFSCARTAPYAPIIGVPPEARGLDPAWESCNAWYGGLFDPPKALQPAEAIATPTLPSTATSPAATPQPTVDSGLPLETSAPAMTSPKPQETQSQPVGHPTHVPSKTNSDEPIDDSGVMSSVGESIESSGDEVSEPAATKTGTSTLPNSSKGVAAIVSMFLTQGGQAIEVDDEPPLVTQASGSASHISQGVVISAGSEVHTALSSQGLVILNGAPLMNGQATIISGQTISAESGTVLVNGVPQQASVLERPSLPHGIFTVAGQEHTAVQQSNDVVEVDGESYNFGAVTAVDSFMITVASEGVIAGATVIPYAMPLAQTKQGTVFTINGHTYSVSSQSGSLYVNGVPASVGDEIAIDGGVLTIDSHAVNVEGATIPLSGGPPVEPTAAAGASVVISEEKITAIKDGVDVLIAGTRLILGQVTAISGIQISVASNGIVIGPSTATFYETESPTPGPGDAVTVDGTVYSASTMADHYDAVLLAGHTLSEGGPAATIHGQVITNGPDEVSIIDPTTSFTVISATNNLKSVVIIDGTAYTAAPAPGHSSAVVLQGQTLSIGGSGMRIADHLVTKGSNGISVADSTSLASDSSSGSTSSADKPESSTVQQNPAAPSEESSASKLEHGFEVVMLVVAILLFSYVNF